MGRALLLSVALTALGLITVNNSGRDGQSRASERIARDQRFVLAQQGAAGGMASALSRVTREFEGWRSGYPSTTTGDLSFEVTAEGPAMGPVRLNAIGTYGDARHRVETIVSRLTDGPGALVIDADTASVAFSGTNWLVSGTDAAARTWLRTEPPDEGTGHGSTVRAIRTRTEGLATTLRDAVGGGGNRVRGIGSSHDIETATSPELTALADEVGTIAQSLHTLSEPHVFSNYVSASGTTLGSPTSPTAVHVRGDFTALTGSFVGHGALLVEGDFRVGADFEWNGVIIVRGKNDTDVRMSGQASIYGGLYVLHEAGYSLGDGIYPYKSLWNVDDHRAVLQYFVASEDTVSVHEEGALQGVNFPSSSDDDLVDVEGFAFLPNGTMFFVNNSEVENALYSISPTEFDGDPTTPVAASYVGPTGRTSSQDEITGMVMKNGVLWGLGRRNQTVYEINTTTGQATAVRTFSTPSGTGEFLVGGLSLGPNGAVYTNRLRPDNYIELWRFDAFPHGDPVLVSSLGYRETASSRMGAAMAIAPDGSVFIHERTELRKGTTGSGVESVLSFPCDIDGMEMFWEGEGGNSNGPVPNLDLIPWQSGYGPYSHTVPWSGGPDVTVTVSFSDVSGTPTSGGRYAFGSTFQEMRASADLGGAAVTSGAADFNYDGPSPLPMFRFKSGGVTSGLTAFTVRFDFSADWPGPFYLYVADLDFRPLTIAARDGTGMPLSTAAWTKDTDMDVLGAVDMAPYDWSPDGSWANPLGIPGAAQLEHPSTSEKELGFVGIRIPDTSVRSITLSGTSPDEGLDQMGLTLSREPLFTSATSQLTFSMSGSAQIVHSAEAIGLLAALVPSLEGRSYLITRDRFGRDLPVEVPPPASAGPPSQATDPTDS